MFNMFPECSVVPGQVVVTETTYKAGSELKASTATMLSK